MIVSITTYCLCLSDKTAPYKKSPVNRCKKYFSFFNIRYLFFVAAVTFGGMGYFIPFNLIYSMMTSRGQTKQFSSLTLSLSGVGSIMSRVLVGFLGDYKCFHRIYYLIGAMTLCAAINVLVVHLTVFWQYLVYGCLYGMGSGKLS